jgi:hypothetical protein
LRSQYIEIQFKYQSIGDFDNFKKESFYLSDKRVLCTGVASLFSEVSPNYIDENQIKSFEDVLGLYTE